MVRGGVPLACAAALLLVAGCLQGTDLGPPTMESRQAFSIPEPEWRPGHKWEFESEGMTPYSFEVAAIAYLDGRTGAVGISTEGEPYFWPEFMRPGFQQLARLHAFGRLDDRCAMGLDDLTVQYYTPDGKVRDPLLHFPLDPGKTWQTMPFGEGRLRLVNEFSVQGLEEVEVPAGTFEAVRIEVLAWYAREPDSDQGTGPSPSDGEEAQRLRGPVAVFHYAPEAHAVVRLEVPGAPYPAHPGLALSVGFVPLTPDIPTSVIQLTSFSLIEAAPMSDAEIIDSATRGLCTQQAKQLEQDSLRALPVPTPAIMLAPDLRVLWAPEVVTWHVEVENATHDSRVEWRVREGRDGPIVASGEGAAFSHGFTLPGGYLVEAELVEGDGSSVAKAHAAVVMNHNVTGTVECLATVDTTWIPPISSTPRPHVGGCGPFVFQVGPGDAIIDARVQGRDGDAMVPCAYLALLDPDGEEVQRVFSDKVAGARLDRLVHSDARGEWTLAWHPALTAASQAEFDVNVTYLPPDRGYGYRGSGSPGC